MSPDEGARPLVKQLSQRGNTSLVTAALQEDGARGYRIALMFAHDLPQWNGREVQRAPPDGCSGVPVIKTFSLNGFLSATEAGSALSRANHCGPAVNPNVETRAREP
jgi:hypothetical protein